MELNMAHHHQHQQLPSGSTSPTAVDECVLGKSEATVTAATRRKSSTWKAFNIKKQLIKVDSRLRNTFVTAASPEPQKSSGGASTFYTDAGDGSDAAATTPTNPPLAFAHNDRNEYLEQIESEIVQSLNEVQATGNEESIVDAAESLASYESHSVVTPRSILNTANSDAESCSPMATAKKVEFTCEEPVVQRVAFVSPVEGACVSRPSDLALSESTADDVVDRPVPPPRSGKYKSNKQRLLSVPNIKYAKQQPTEFPMRGKMSVGHKDSLANLMPVTGSGHVASGGNQSNANAAATAPGTSSSFANSFMRRFSKYQLGGGKGRGAGP